MAIAPPTETTARRSERLLTTMNLRQTIADAVASVRPRSPISLRFVVVYALLTAVVLFLTQLLLLTVVVYRPSFVSRHCWYFYDGDPMMTALEHYAALYYFRQRPTKVASFRHVVVGEPTDGLCGYGGGGDGSGRRNRLDR